jgi:hypothetical protein
MNVSRLPCGCLCRGAEKPWVKAESLRMQTIIVMVAVTLRGLW